MVGAAGRADDVDQLVQDALAREATSPTGLPGGIAIPHCRTAGVERADPGLRPAVTRQVDFGAKDGPADLAFLIAAPAGRRRHPPPAAHQAGPGAGQAGLHRLRCATRRRPTRSSTLVMRRGSAPAAAKVAAAAAAAARPPRRSAPTSVAAPARAYGRSLVAVTACPTGIAHTYMAAEALEAAAARAGVDIAVETQGSAGSHAARRPTTIAAADAVIFAVDVGVRDRGRFAGKPLVSSGRQAPDRRGRQDDRRGAALRRRPERTARRGRRLRPRREAAAAANETWGGRIRRVLMTGVSYMIPFVAAGGLLIALGFLFGGYEIVEPSGEIATDNTLFNLPDPSALGLTTRCFGSAFFAYIGALLFVLGGAAFGFLVPALAGYIAYAIADRPGIAPGFVMGAIAGTLGTGFIGGIIGGVLAGLVAHWIAQLQGAHLGARPDAGAGHPAAGHPGQPASSWSSLLGKPLAQAHRQAHRRSEQPERRARPGHPARRRSSA